MENETIQNNKITEEVLRKIEGGEVKMRSRAYFVFKVGVLIALTFITLVTSIVLVSYLIFSMKVGGQFLLLGFGTRGIYKFFMILPWFLLVFNAFFLFFLDYLLRRFKFGYNSPLVYLFLGTLVFVTTFSFLVNYTSFHTTILSKAERDNMSLLGGFYSDLRKSHKSDGILKGQVVSIGDDYLIIKHFDYDRDEGFDEEKIYLQDGMNLNDFIKIGDEIFVAGEIASGTEIRAYGVHRVVNR